MLAARRTLLSCAARRPPPATCRASAGQAMNRDEVGSH